MDEEYCYLSQFFWFDSEGLLYWHPNHQGHEANSVVTTSVNGNGYLHSRLAGQLYEVHRVIWMLHNDCDIPSGMEIDHEDTNKLNNSPRNLRLVTRNQNCHNRNNYKSNTTGVKGVGWHKGKLRGRIMLNGRQYHIGYFKDLDEASVKMIEARNKLHKEFANHGINS